MSPEIQRAETGVDALVGMIYEAALEPPRWQTFVDALADELNGNTVAVWIQLPGLAGPARRWSSARDEIDPEIFARFWADPPSFPWPNETNPENLERFVQERALDPSAPIEETDFYRQWMEPQGLAPSSPVVHVFGFHGGHVVASAVVSQTQGNPPVSAEELDFLDRLVPHLRRAYRIHDRVAGLVRQEDVLQEVTDRLPIAVMLVDVDGRVIGANKSARASIESGNGLRVQEGRPYVDDPDDNARLQDLIRKAANPSSREEFREGTGVTNASREGHAPVLVTPLLAPQRESPSPEAAAAIFLGDPKLAEIVSDEMLRTLYQLTRAESELTRLLADGHSLEDAACQRGVKLNTARSQLKRIFVKTGARRQSDLVRIVLTGISALRGE